MAIYTVVRTEKKKKIIIILAASLIKGPQFSEAQSTATDNPDGLFTPLLSHKPYSYFQTTYVDFFIKT